MSQVGHWLESLGLGEYRGRFAENAIDASVLPELTERNLEELGVRVGHRLKLLRAIEELRRSGRAMPEPAALAKEAGELRQLSVLFCDLVDSTALTAQLGAEAMSRLMAAFHACVAEVITRHVGFVDECQGDGVLALFGFPEAHEDDAEQAIRAGLALVEAVGGLRAQAGIRLHARVAIATSTVVVRHQVSQGAGRTQRVVGEAPNLAARLHALAPPSGVVTCARTRALATGLFEGRDLGERPLKGWAAPVGAWQVLGPSGVVSRLEARLGRVAAPLGRDEELELLLRRWRDAARGEGRVVILCGEAGIGKSHIALALQERLLGEPHARLRYFCSAHHANSALFPFIGQLESAARFARGDSPEAKLAKLAALLAESPHESEALALIASLLSLTPREPAALQALSAQERRARTLAAIMAHVEALAMRQPVVMVFEDAHWADATSLELLTMLVERLPALPVLLVITARTKEGEEGFRPPWAAHAHVKTIVLNYLGRRECEALIIRTAGGRALPDEVLKAIAERADGVPLFVEEYTKTLLESGQLEERGGRYVLNRTLQALAVPATLHASLMERLDRFGAAKDVAQTAAVIGREFSHELLSAVPGSHRENLERALGELVRSGLVYQRGVAPHAVYRFKHALLRDEAYAGLLTSRRAELHAAIACALEERFPEVAQSQPETLAHHFSEAGLPRRALPYWLRSGRDAARRSANVEAIAHLRKGMEQAQSLSESAERDRLELDFAFSLAPCLIATQGPASSESLAVFSRARQLCERLGKAPEYPQVMFWLATAAVVRGELEAALEATAAMQRDAEARGDHPARINAVRGQAMIHLFMGRLAEAEQGIHLALALFAHADERQRLAARAAGQDAGAAGHAQLSWVLWLRGHVDKALTQIEAASSRAAKMRHPHTETYVCYYASILYALRGEHAKAHERATRCMAISKEQGFRQWIGLARAVQTTCASMLQPSSGVLDTADDDLEEYRAAGYRLGVTVLYALRGEALLRSGLRERALDTLELGLATAQRNGERIVEAELCRLKAQALAAGGSPEERLQARSWLQRAVDLARSQDARSLELRAAHDLVAL